MPAWFAQHANSHQPASEYRRIPKKVRCGLLLFAAEFGKLAASIEEEVRNHAVRNGVCSRFSPGGLYISLPQAGFTHPRQSLFLGVASQGFTRQKTPVGKVAPPRL